ncbi:MAG TPA: serine hydrolase, partial [Pseudomonadales bacterium]|nr:serine hydrolase [Pseudomonadales bacterium]
SPRDSTAGTLFNRHAVGHLGFTGTSMWLDLDRPLHIILLSNRVHPDRDHDAIREFRPLIHDTVMRALQ